MKKSIWYLVLCLFSFNGLLGQTQDTVNYMVKVKDAQQHLLDVEMQLTLSPEAKETVVVSIPTWMPGYYQLMNYAEKVSGFQVKNEEGKLLPAEKKDPQSWQIQPKGNRKLIISYMVKADRNFVASPYLDEAHAYLVSTGVFLYPVGELQRPARISIDMDQQGWKDVATGLERVSPDNPFIVSAANYDVLYDSPILVGNLSKLPTFYVRQIPHDFYAFAMQEGDGQALMDDLKKAVTAAVDLIGDIPYNHYTFIGIGQGRGGIEHLNSTTVSFDGPPQDSAGRVQVLNFLTHEYFHHYNVKRIRPIELGPFDYSKPNRTKQLWISEGLTVYYEFILLNRAGIYSPRQVLDLLAAQITQYEANEGKHYQTLAEASEQTWEDGPFGERSGKSISYYVKGPIVGLLFDLAIRKATEGKKSLDDVMRQLYYRYDKELGRGFTEQEFKEVCKTVSGSDLTELFEYIYTTKELNYAKYLGYAGLSLIKEGDRYLLQKQANASKEANQLFHQFLIGGKQ